MNLAEARVHAARNTTTHPPTHRPTKKVLHSLVPPSAIATPFSSTSTVFEPNSFQHFAHSKEVGTCFSFHSSTPPKKLNLFPLFKWFLFKSFYLVHNLSPIENPLTSSHRHLSAQRWCCPGAVLRWNLVPARSQGNGSRW